MSLHVFCSCSNWILCFLLSSSETFLYILDTSPLSMGDLQILSLCSLSFYPPNRSLPEQKVLIFIKFNLPIFLFTDCVLVSSLRNLLGHLCESVSVSVCPLWVPSAHLSVPRTLDYCSFMINLEIR